MLTLAKANILQNYMSSNLSLYWETKQIIFLYNSFFIIYSRFYNAYKNNIE